MLDPPNPYARRRLHNYIKPTILSFPRRRKSSVFNDFLDTGTRALACPPGYQVMRWHDEGGDFSLRFSPSGGGRGRSAVACLPCGAFGDRALQPCGMVGNRSLQSITHRLSFSIHHPLLFLSPIAYRSRPVVLFFPLNLNHLKLKT